MKPASDPRWNRQYVEQRLRDKRADAEMRRIAESPITIANDADYWYGEYLDATARCTTLETENAKLRLVVQSLLAARPSSRTVKITEIW